MEDTNSTVIYKFKTSELIKHPHITLKGIL